MSLEIMYYLAGYSGKHLEASYLGGKVSLLCEFDTSWGNSVSMQTPLKTKEIRKDGLVFRYFCDIFSFCNKLKHLKKKKKRKQEKLYSRVCVILI